ncbi:hypothetical protein BX666DRAFT_2026860 [Dichotomocladium elegans]|nr:hypothetical protein BX666DRAFT_2026860 [Dichotomocladium elegans]
MKEANIKRHYVRYTVQDKVRFLNLKIEKSMGASTAANQLGIHVQTAERWGKQYNTCPDSIFEDYEKASRYARLLLLGVFRWLAADSSPTRSFWAGFGMCFTSFKFLKHRNFPAVSFSVCTRPRKYGGLGILDPAVQHASLSRRWITPLLHLEEGPSGSFLMPILRSCLIPTVNVSTPCYTSFRRVPPTSIEDLPISADPVFGS